MRVFACVCACSCLQDMLGADNKSVGHRRCKIPAQVLTSLAILEEARGELDKAIATAAVALEFTQSNELALHLFQEWIQDIRSVVFDRQLSAGEAAGAAEEGRAFDAGGKEHILQRETEGRGSRKQNDKRKEGRGTVFSSCDQAAMEAHRVFVDHMQKSHSLTLLRCMADVDVVSRTSLVRAQVNEMKSVQGSQGLMWSRNCYSFARSRHRSRFLLSPPASLPLAPAPTVLPERSLTLRLHPCVCPRHTQCTRALLLALASS